MFYNETTLAKHQSLCKQMQLYPSIWCIQYHWQCIENACSVLKFCPSTESEFPILELTNQTMTVAIDMAAAFKRAKQLRRVKLSAHSVNNAALERVDQQSLWKRATFGALLWLTATLTR
ncbi:hypothetical protein T4A_13997 [Trichinella pseudospiralis]|uniref:Uncharacterized protein n=1 Tax=Trichinella pseudospiralis TaxID=6337 RepID=A0A0V1EXZ5_TRIPS|nr:hypothetical protein T4A_13997 [Trichinella pseudospiralis]